MEEEDKCDKDDRHLLLQAAQLTNGLYLRICYQSDILGYLIHGGFLMGSMNRDQLRGSFKLPQSAEVAMSAFCVCCKEE